MASASYPASAISQSFTGRESYSRVAMITPFSAAQYLATVARLISKCSIVAAFVAPFSRLHAAACAALAGLGAAEAALALMGAPSGFQRFSGGCSSIVTAFHDPRYLHACNLGKFGDHQLGVQKVER